MLDISISKRSRSNSVVCFARTTCKAAFCPLPLPIIIATPLIPTSSFSYLFPPNPLVVFQSKILFLFFWNAKPPKTPPFPFRRLLKMFLFLEESKEVDAHSELVCLRWERSGMMRMMMKEISLVKIFFFLNSGVFLVSFFWSEKGHVSPFSSLSHLIYGSSIN